MGSADAMKKVLELILCILHPVAVVLVWINLVTRSGLGLAAKLAWGIAALVPFVPFLYVLTGNEIL
jgi:TRAP-type C4-dicarboxylate transport system permease small subunit